MAYPTFGSSFGRPPAPAAIAAPSPMAAPAPGFRGQGPMGRPAMAYQGGLNPMFGPQGASQIQHPLGGPPGIAQPPMPTPPPAMQPPAPSPMAATQPPGGPMPPQNPLGGALAGIASNPQVQALIGSLANRQPPIG